MPTYEENMASVLDMRARVLDVNQDDPKPEEIWAAVDALHATRGTAAKKKAEAKPIMDLGALFATTPAKAETSEGKPLGLKEVPADVEPNL